MRNIYPHKSNLSPLSKTQTNNNNTVIISFIFDLIQAYFEFKRLCICHTIPSNYLKIYYKLSSMKLK